MFKHGRIDAQLRKIDEQFVVADEIGLGRSFLSMLAVVMAFCGSVLLSTIVRQTGETVNGGQPCLRAASS